MSTMSAVPAPASWLTGLRVRLPGQPETAAEARRRVHEVLAFRGVPAGTDAAGAAVVVAGELVTNAVQAGPGGPITLCLVFRAGILRIEVHDAAPGEPAVVAEAGLGEGGRGLALVAGLASSWGWYPLPGGKSVYATIQIAGPA